MLPSSPSMPYSPLIGASNESTTIRCGFDSTVWYEPGIGAPSASTSYSPAGMIHVPRAVMTMRMKRIVYADGSANRDRLGSGVVAVALIWPLPPSAWLPD